MFLSSSFARKLALAAIAAVADCRASVCGHIGDRNLHYKPLAPGREDVAQFKQAHEETLSEAVHDLAVSLGGSFSAGDGIGKLKKEAFSSYNDATALDVMRAVKPALYPGRLMNPGKLLWPVTAILSAGHKLW